MGRWGTLRRRASVRGRSTAVGPLRLLQRGRERRVWWCVRGVRMHGRLLRGPAGLQRGWLEGIWVGGWLFGRIDGGRVLVRATGWAWLLLLLKVRWKLRWVGGLGAVSGAVGGAVGGRVIG